MENWFGRVNVNGQAIYFRCEKVIVSIYEVWCSKSGLFLYNSIHNLLIFWDNEPVCLSQDDSDAGSVLGLPEKNCNSQFQQDMVICLAHIRYICAVGPFVLAGRDLDRKPHM